MKGFGSFLWPIHFPANIHSDKSLCMFTTAEWNVKVCWGHEKILVHPGDFSFIKTHALHCWKHFILTSTKVYMWMGNYYFNQGCLRLSWVYSWTTHLHESMNVWLIYILLNEKTCSKNKTYLSQNIIKQCHNNHLF